MSITGQHVKASGVRIGSQGATLDGDLKVPARRRGVVLFAHGSGSSRHSPRNRFVAAELQKSSLATLLLDLLTPEEERADALSGQWRFDISLLSERLNDALKWLSINPSTRTLPIGLFGASTGAAAALVAAAQAQKVVKAVVSRGGRPDLAGEALRDVLCPVLLIVGELDGIVIDLNRKALAQMPGPANELTIVPGAGHLFEEPGTLDEAARLATNWFARYVGDVENA